MKHPKILEISEVTERSGLPASTIRFYEEKGLIQSIGRRGIRRLFDPFIIGRLSLIALGQNAGFSLEEIAAIFARPGKFELDRQMLADKANEIDKNIRKLEAMRDGLRHAAQCPAENHLECPKFQRIVKISTNRNRYHRQDKKTRNLSTCTP